MGRFLKSSLSQPSRPSYFSFPFLIFFPRAGRAAQVVQRTLAYPACLLSIPQPTLILAHSGPATFLVHPRVAQWPAPTYPDSFILTTPAEAEPSACAATCLAPLPPDVVPTSTLPACARACRGLHHPLRTPPPPYPFEGDFEPKQNEKTKNEIHVKSAMNSPRIFVSDGGVVWDVVPLVLDSLAYK
jgi:hypothetical protein